jgi:hypothetical protein
MPSLVRTTTSSSLVTFAMSHPSPQPYCATGPFHLCLQPSHRLAVDEPPSPNCEPPPRHREPSHMSPSLRHLARHHPATFPVLSMKTSSRTHRRWARGSHATARALHVVTERARHHTGRCGSVGLKWPLVQANSARPWVESTAQSCVRFFIFFHFLFKF